MFNLTENLYLVVFQNGLWRSWNQQPTDSFIHGSKFRLFPLLSGNVLFIFEKTIWNTIFDYKAESCIHPIFVALKLVPEYCRNAEEISILVSTYRLQKTFKLTCWMKSSSLVNVGYFAVTFPTQANKQQQVCKCEIFFTELDVSVSIEPSEK